MLCYITCMHVMLSNMCYNIKYVVITSDMLCCVTYVI